MMQPIIVIPSRLAATRLPRKPLAMIGTKPMVVRVAEAARAAQVGPVIVAAGDKEIIETVADLDVHPVLTDPSLASGSDRVYQALEQFDPDGQYDTVINLQGDLPFINPRDLSLALRPIVENDFDIGTLVAAMREDEDPSLASIVKAVCAFDTPQSVARGHYFSRSIVPWGSGDLWHHVGVYAWKRSALKRFVQAPPSALERRESLEQLRALDLGLTIGCVRVEAAPISVDTPEDLARAQQVLA